MTSSSTLPKKLLKIPEVEKKINERLDELLQAMFDLALGHYVVVQQYNKNTGEIETRIFDKEPDFKALAFLMENVIGKVPTRLEMSGAGGGPIKIVPWMTMAEGIRQGLLGSGKEDEEEEEAEEDVTEGEFHEVEDGAEGNS